MDFAFDRGESNLSTANFVIIIFITIFHEWLRGNILILRDEFESSMDL